jgi:hypothetical protein
MEMQLKEKYIHELLEQNEKAGRQGMLLTAEEAAWLIEARSRALRYFGRIELDLSVSKSLIGSFCESPLICREEYTQILQELLEIFYFLKNETRDMVGDAELVSRLRDSFENECGGSVELLKGRWLEEYLQNFRKEQLYGSRILEGDELK